MRYNRGPIATSCFAFAAFMIDDGFELVKLTVEPRRITFAFDGTDIAIRAARFGEPRRAHTQAEVEKALRLVLERVTAGAADLVEKRP